MELTKEEITLLREQLEKLKLEKLMIDSKRELLKGLAPMNCCDALKYRGKK